LVLKFILAMHYIIQTAISSSLYLCSVSYTILSVIFSFQGSSKILVIVTTNNGKNIVPDIEQKNIIILPKEDQTTISP